MLTIRRRGKNFHIRGTIRVGRETRIIKEHSCGTDRRDDAEAYRSKLEAEIRHEILYGSRGRTHTLTIADALLAYVKRPGGLRSYDLARIDEINRLVGDFTIAQAADAWTDFKRKQCAALSVVAVQRFRATFQAALNHLGREENFDVPALPKRSPHERKVKKRVRWLPSKRAHLLIFSYAAHVQPVAITLRWQGLRIGEALRVDWSHVNWKANSIFIPESKNGESRSARMHPKTRTALHRLWVARGSPTEGIVFVTNRKPYRDPRDYKVPSGSPIKKAHATACKRAGIVDFHVHDWWRHWASRCVMAGIDLETIRQEGGWKSLRMVERYATVSAAHRSRAMAKLK
jgi:integrase